MRSVTGRQIVFFFCFGMIVGIGVFYTSAVARIIH